MMRFTRHHHTKEEIIQWIEAAIDATNAGMMTVRPCITGLQDALHYLRENNDAAAKPAEVKVVSRGEIDAVIARLEKVCHVNREEARYYPDIHFLLNYVKTALKPKMKTVWCVSYTFGSVQRLYKSSDEEATKSFCVMALSNSEYTNVSPIWTQEVPA